MNPYLTDEALAEQLTWLESQVDAVRVSLPRDWAIAAVKELQRLRRVKQKQNNGNPFYPQQP
jgi:hypothetical protein